MLGMLRAEGVWGTQRYYAAAVSRKVARRLQVKGANKVMAGGGGEQPVSPSPNTAPSLPADVEAHLSNLASADIVVICAAYPGPDQPYGGEFIRTRVEGYVKASIRVSVLVVSARVVQPKFEDCCLSSAAVLRVPRRFLESVLRQVASGNSAVFIHSPAPDFQSLSAEIIDRKRISFWFHGFEIRDYRRLYFNYNTSEMARLRIRLDDVNAQRFSAAKIALADSDIKKVFVSKYLRKIAEIDTEVVAQNAYIIPNSIDVDRFKFVKKTGEQATKILLIRSFSRANYGNDIALNAIRILSQRPGFEKLHFTIRGFGELFGELTQGVRQFSNVDVEEKYCTPDEMAALHRQHGVFLCPSRFDTQGVTMGEAMSSGLVCITNRVAGIPEYIDEKSGVVVPPNDPRAFADAISWLQSNPSVMPRISQEAGRRVRRQCGFPETIAREIELSRQGHREFALDELN